MTFLKQIASSLLAVVWISFSYAQFAGGSGTQADPWQVATAEHLNNIRNYTLSTYYFIQTADINLNVAPYNSGEGWQPAPFYGNYDGSNHIIQGLFINRPSTSYVGLYSWVNGKVMNLNLIDVNVTGAGTVGGLAGQNANNSKIDNCHVSGSVTATQGRGGLLVGYNYDGATIITCSSSGSAISGAGYDYVGGLVGKNEKDAKIILSHSGASVQGSKYAGGLVGCNYDKAYIAYCNATGQVSSISSCVGGLAGAVENSAFILDSYSRANVQGTTKVGGLVGSFPGGLIIRSYSLGLVTATSGTAGALIGEDVSSAYYSLIQCYWNQLTTGQSNGYGGQGRSTAEMSYPHASNTFEDWDFDDVWAEDTDGTVNGGYPYLIRQFDANPPVSVAPSIGTGSPEDPYQVTSLANLLWIGEDSSRLTKHYLQTADIDASPTKQWDIFGWSPIGNSTVKFTGSYDGANHSITHLYMQRLDSSSKGFFGPSQGAKINNVYLQSIDFTLGGTNASGLVGSGRSATVIDNCKVDGRLIGNAASVGLLVGELSASYISRSSSSGTLYGWQNVGGLAGLATLASRITGCSSDTQVRILGTDGGGLAGKSEQNSQISACSSRGSVDSIMYGITYNAYQSGGLVGTNSSSLIENCYSLSSLSGRGNYCGGLVGSHTGSTPVSNCFSIGLVNQTGSCGGLIGSGSGTVTNSYWNIETSGRLSSSGGSPRATNQMSYPYSDTYMGWNMRYWLSDTDQSHNSGYPYLHFEHHDIAQVPAPAHSPSPIEGGSSSTLRPTFNWEPDFSPGYSNLPTGFKLWLGTNDPPSNLIDGLDLGYVFSYQPGFDLQSSTNYFWKIVPYNQLGEAQSCPVWNFSSYDPVPRISYPVGDETWMTGTTQVINWLTNAPATVRLKISFNNGVDWYQIADVPGSQCHYYYQVPASPSAACLIRISNAADDTAFSVSASPFIISNSGTLPKLILSYPSASGLHLVAGQSISLSWTRLNVSLVNLDFSGDGLTWIPIAEALNADSYLWTLPDSPSSTCRIRVSSTQDPNIRDFSDNTFRLCKLELLDPGPGEFVVGDHSSASRYMIRWNAPAIDNIKLEYSSNGGSTWTNLITSTSAGTGFYEWTVPGTPTQTGLIRLTNTANTAIQTVSQVPFRIQNPVLIMNANGGGFVTDNALFNIRWLPQVISSVSRLWWEYSLNQSTWTRINTSAVPVNGGYLAWVVGTGLQTSVWLRAIEESNGRIVAKSESSFRVTDKILKITAPTTAEVLGVGNQTMITWQASGCTNLSIDYSTDFGLSWITIATGVSSAQSSYLWQVPNTPSTQCRIRLRDATHSYMWVESEGEFTIHPFYYEAAFHADVTSGFADLHVQFYDDSVGIVSGWSWDFNSDGNIDSTEQNPLWIFRAGGFYSVTLTITDGEQNYSSTRENYIYVYPLDADFSANPLSGFLPLTVSFTNTTPTDVYYSQWDFNADGIIDSTDENPIWTYLFPGTYTVTQTVSNGYDQDTEVKQNLITASLNPARLRYVPTQFTTIQAAVNASTDGDYIIIANGVYYENVVIEGKNITLASYYLLDGNPAHIINTVINGSQAINPDQASTLTILPASGRPVSKPHVIGFTIQSGSGRRVFENVGGSTVEKRVGGGVYIRQSDPVFSYNRIVDNEADDEGGGSYAFQSLPNHGGMVNPAIGVFNPGGNYFGNNSADIGADIYIYGVTSRDELKLQNCSFEVISQSDTTVSNYWVTSAANMNYQGSSGRHPAISSDVWVATNGNDHLNSGLSPSSSFRTIDHALSRIYATEANPLTVHIASGTYSPSLTGEKFPLQMVKHVSLQGSGTDETFLDAEGSADFPRRVLNLDKVEGVQISDLTLMNGFVTLAKNYNGGAIGILNSQASLQRLIIAGSSSAGNGAGIYALSSTLEAESLDIQYNSALGSGGGIHSVQSALSLSSSQISNNSVSKNGAGISIDGGQVLITECQISQNQATGYQSKGGGLSISGTADALISGNRITANNADNGAGAYLQDNTALRLDRNRLSNNLADYSGGALFINTSTGYISNNLIAHNTATQRGGALYCYSPVNLLQNTVVKNKAGLQGGGLYLNSASPTLNGNIVWGNVQTASDTPNQFYLFGEGSDPQFRYCLVEAGSAGFILSPGTSYTGIYQNNLDLDPLFTGPVPSAGYHNAADDDTYSLSESSACVDAGDPLADLLLWPLDLIGNPRLDNGRVDIGAWEKPHFTGPRLSVQPSSLDFGRVNINGQPLSLELSLHNTGNQPLQITGLSFQSPDAGFILDSQTRDQIIAPGSSQVLSISFLPLSVGPHSNALLIHSNSLFTPVLSVPLSGYGIDASGSLPSNVQLQIVGDDVHLAWDPVVSDDNGDPVTPDEYVILYSENADTAPGNYFYHGCTQETSYVHTGVVRHRNKMFYRIIAIDSDTRIRIEALLARYPRQKPLTWGELEMIMAE